MVARCFLSVILALAAASSEARDMKRMTIQEFFNSLSKDNLHLVDEFYDRNVQFQDPVGMLQGSDRVKAYYARMYKNVKSIRFDFTSETAQGSDVMVAWTMHLSASSLNGGDPIAVDGVSHIRYDAKGEKVTFHRDYFDMGAFVYEHIPVLGWGVRTIRKQMALH